jgi:hypothetical protein
MARDLTANQIFIINLVRKLQFQSRADAAFNTSLDFKKHFTKSLCGLKMAT